MSKSLGEAPSTISECGNLFECQAATVERDGYTKRFEDIISDQDVSERMITRISKDDGLQDTMDTDYETAEA